VTGDDRPLLVVLRALKLGDLLAAVPALRALARHFPEHHRVLAAPAWLAPLARHTGTVDEVVDIEPLAFLAPRLHGADVAVNLHGRGPQSTALLEASRPRRLVSFGRDGVEWRADEHEVDRWCRLLAESGIPADRDDLLLPPVDVEPPAGVAGATIVHPGASTPARCWPVDRWAAVARAEVTAGHPVVVTGGPDEVAAARRVAAMAGLPDDAVLAGRTGLLDLAAAVAAAGRVVCGDTGVAHLATALATPSVVLFGPVPPSQWGPPSIDRHIALWAGRTGDPHADDVDPGLLAITVDQVIDALRALPDGAASAPLAHRS
jgi:ADP-heptose:LPS heptosyltransferase